MLTFTQLTEQSEPLSGCITLPFDKRQKSRLRATLDSGDDVALILPRGGVLKDGDCLLSDTGEVILVKAADEKVSTVYCDNARQLAQVAYHLGNRHVSLQVGDGWVRYAHDHVLDQMVIQLGLSVEVELAPFHPESGAYHNSHSAHHHHEHE